MSSLQVTDSEAAAVAVAPRVTLANINEAIASEITFVAGEVLKDAPTSKALDLLSICLVTMKNGFTVVGKSAPASPENFNRELGFKFAREDAIRQIWPLMGFSLRDRLANS